MKDIRELLEQEIINSAKQGDTTVLAEILASLSDEYVFGALSDDGQESLNWDELKLGDKIIALVDTNGCSNSYNAPERIDIKEGTILEVSTTSNRGDCFTNFISGDAVKTLRGGQYEGETRILKSGDTIILRGGHRTRCPYDVGIINLKFWKKL
jgi:hypothetical protein